MVVGTTWPDGSVTLEVVWPKQSLLAFVWLGHDAATVPFSIRRRLTAKQTFTTPAVPKLASVCAWAPFQSVTPVLTKRSLLSVTVLVPSVGGGSAPHEMEPATARANNGEMRRPAPLGRLS